MALELRGATEADLFFINGLETDPDAKPWLMRWTHERHLESFHTPDEEPLIVEDDGQPVGYALLSGLTNEHLSVEVRRIIVARKGEGIGRQALKQIVDYAFERYEPHRVWLDLMTGNDRARRAYESVGFVEEGTLRESLLTDDGYRSMVVMSVLEYEWRIRRNYELFNARAIDQLLAGMTEDVVWPHAAEGTHLLGRQAVRRYWEAQWAEHDPQVEPLAIEKLDDGRIEVRVHQVVKDLEGAVLLDTEVLHVYDFKADLVARMEIVELAARPETEGT